MIDIIRKISSNKNVLWNTAAGLINAAEAVIILMVVSRTNGLEDSGIISLAFAIGNLMSTIGRFGMRNYQVTDVNNKYEFDTYFTSRIITVLVMGISSVLYMMFCYNNKGYDWYKISVVLLICLVYMVECLEDVFWGLYQRNGRLDLGGKIFFIRWFIHLAVICVMLIITHNIILSFIVGIVCGTVYTIIANCIHFREFYQGRLLTNIGTFGVLKSCFPLFLAFFLTNYVTNSPKYAIDRYMDDRVQACYGYIAMPVFVISLLNSFIYQPILVDMANKWKRRKYGGFTRMIVKQMIILAMLILVVMIAGYILGIPVLSWLYATDLSAYKLEFMVLLFGGGLLAIAGFLGVVMTVMRIQILNMFGYIVAALMALGLSGIFVKNWGVLGATILYDVLLGAVSIIFAVFVAKWIRKKRLGKKIIK